MDPSVNVNEKANKMNGDDRNEFPQSGRKMQNDGS